MGTLVQIGAPTSEPVSLVEAKNFVRAGESDDNSIADMIKSARQVLDGHDGQLGRALVTQTWRLTIDGFPGCGEIRLPLPPLQSVSSVKYLDLAGAQQTLSTSVYGSEGDDRQGRVYLKSNQSWPPALCQPGAVQVDFVCGYTAVPEPLRLEILGLVKSWYDGEAPAGQLPDKWRSQYQISFPAPI